jgi:hypothetical protein
MTTKPDGGPAFPHDGRDNGPGNIKGRAHDGMTLRDWFAGQALAVGMVAIGRESGPVRWDAFATDCYLAADAMLSARGGRDE